MMSAHVRLTVVCSADAHRRDSGSDETNYHDPRPLGTWITRVTASEPVLCCLDPIREQEVESGDVGGCERRK